MTRDLTKLAFDSEVNYMKRSEFCGSVIIQPISLGASATHTITHNLGYIPFYQVAVDMDDDGTIWTDKISEYTGTSLTGYDDAFPKLEHWITSTELTITLTEDSVAASTSEHTLYWLIYLDYGDVS